MYKTAIMNRRHLLALVGTASATALLPKVVAAAPAPAKTKYFIPSLNMSTIMGHKLGFRKELETASKGGYRHVEIWMNSLQQFLQEGNKIADARSILKDTGIEVVNCIGFAEWIVDDEARRKKGLTQLAQEMELLAAIGCKRTAAPPMGAVQEPGLSLKRAAERYRTILELGDKTGVVPQLELWGFAQNLNRLADVSYVSIESGHPSARMLLDVYHLYKGQSAMQTLPMINPNGVEIFHLNDYTNSTRPADITDADRIYPGMGVAPIREQLQLLRHPSRPLIISVELFNKEYYKQDPLVVVQTALKQTQRLIADL